MEKKRKKRAGALHEDETQAVHETEGYCYLP